jgi:5-methylcytosine-specific restriction endonuclease McrA
MPHKDPAARAAYQLAYREANREAIRRTGREATRRWRAANPRPKLDRSPRPCAECGVTFTPAPIGTVAKVCSPACRKRANEAKLRAANPNRPAELAAKAKPYRAAWHKANPERAKAAQDRYRAAHREELRARAREAQALERATKPEAVRARQRRTREADPARSAAWDKAKRAKRRAAERRKVTARDLRRLELRQGGACAYCGKVCELTLEHVVPLARGGRHAIGNLVMACSWCNNSKGPRLLTEWRYRTRTRTLERIAA